MIILPRFAKTDVPYPEWLLSAILSSRKSCRLYIYILF